MAYGFRPRGRASGASDTIQTFIIGGTTVKVGDLVKLSSGKVVAATTGATASVVGVVVGPADYTTDMDNLTINVSEVRVQTDADAIYASDDANARINGAALDMTGATGAMALTTDSNSDFVVVANSTATQETLVSIAPDTHYRTVT